MVAKKKNEIIVMDVISIKSASQLIRSKWLLLVTFFCQSLFPCIYIGLSDETTLKQVQKYVFCKLNYSSPAKKGNQGEYWLWEE